MRPLSKNESWVALALGAAFTVSGFAAVFGVMPNWTPVVIWIAFAFLLIRSQLRRTDRQTLGDTEK